MGIIAFIFGERDPYVAEARKAGYYQLIDLREGKICWQEYLDQKFDLVKADLRRAWYAGRGGWLERRRCWRLTMLRGELALAHRMVDNNRLPDLRVSQLRCLLVLEQAAEDALREAELDTYAV